MVTGIELLLLVDTFSPKFMVLIIALYYTHIFMKNKLIGLINVTITVTWHSKTSHKKSKSYLYLNELFYVMGAVHKLLFILVKKNGGGAFNT